MSDKKIRAVVYGVGKVGRLAIRYAIEDGIEIVGAIGNVNNLGADVGELAGIGPIGVLLEKDADAVLERSKPDIVMLCTGNETEEVYDQFERCLRHKANIVTVCGQLYGAWCFNKELSDKLDALAKENGVTILGTGVEDSFWNVLCSVIASASRKITEIKGSNVCIVDDFGPMTRELSNAGLTVEEFNEKFSDKSKIAATAYLPTLDILAKQMGLTILPEETVMDVAPAIAKADIHLPQYDLHVPAGLVCGTREILVFKTAEGVDLRGEFTGKLGEPGDDTGSHWTIKGEPDLDNVTIDPQGELTTATIMVNRIADVINARPGYLSVADMPMPRYHAKPMSTYLND